MWSGNGRGMPFCSLSAMEVKIRIGEEKGAQESQVGGRGREGDGRG